MKLWVGSLFTIAVVAIVSVWFASWARNTCQPLDRMFGWSGCAGTVEVARFSPLLFGTMVATGADDTVSLFGWELDEQGNRMSPALIRLNLHTDREQSRSALPIGTGFDHVVFSTDRQKALLTCTTRHDCAGDGSQAAIVSTLDGELLALVDEWETYPRVFPGDPLPPSDFSAFAVLASEGGAVVDVDEAGNIFLTNLSTSEVHQLAAKEERRDQFAPRFTVSPDQTRIAMISTTYGQRTIGDLLQVWDASGRQIMSMAGSPDYQISSNAAWSSEADTLLIPRKAERGLRIDSFVLP